jgi:hypothetical protein
MEEIKKNIMEKFHQSIQEELKIYEEELKSKIYQEIQELIGKNKSSFEKKFEINQTVNIEISKNLLSNKIQEIDIKKEQYSNKLFLKKRKRLKEEIEEKDDFDYGHAFIRPSPKFIELNESDIIYINDDD